jgi:hypothetical protein
MASEKAAHSIWTFRPAAEQDVDGLTALHERVFGRMISREQWLWKLRRQPGPVPVPNVWVAEADGRLVFQYAGIPTRFRHRASDCWAMIDVDTMTHPDYRRRGLLTQGARVAYGRWRDAGIAFTVGLPNEQWGSRAAALGWVTLGELRWWVRWLDPIRVLAAKAKLRGWGSARAPEERHRGVPGGSSPDDPPVPSMDHLRVSSMDDPAPFDELWDRIGQEGVVRDAAWFRWRYLEAVPKWNVLGAWQRDRLAGGVAFHLDASRDCPSGLLGEVMAPTFRVARLLLLRSCDALRAMGAVRAALLIQPRSVLEEAALAAGFLPRPAAFSVDAVDLGGGLPRACRFQGGDFDVV